MKHLQLKILFIFVISSLFLNCARRGTPIGGPKDSIPPVLVKAIPKIESVNFKAEKIKIYFDEYIKLKDVKKNLVISPPQKNDPEIIPVGTASKYISIKILDTLDANTTYSFNFGNSIIDNNESNELGNFKYVFSTGIYIDSLSLSGKVTDPLLKKSVKGIDVLLYAYNENFTDSIIYKEKPRYIANTLDSTLFNLTNLKEGKYLMIALQDVNNNKIYNPKTDKIGFIKDTISLPIDSSYNFTLLKEIPELKVIRPKEEVKGHLIFGFEGDAHDLDIKLLTTTPKDFKSEIIYDAIKDTIHYWYSPFETDSLNFEVSKNEYLEPFTARIRSSKIDSLKIEHSGNTLHLLDTFSLNSNTPIVQFDKSLISLFSSDSIPVNFEPSLSKTKTKLYLNFEKKYKTLYTVKLLPDALVDIYDIASDSLNYKFNTKSPDDYGILKLNFTSNYSKSLIVELLNNKEQLVRVLKIDAPQEIIFNSLSPDTYFVRVTFDENSNGKWDTGNYLNKQQPEKIIYFKKPLELRANWENNETFDLNQL